ncbi:MAG: hypothetical protein EAY70_05020 [Sphingomonadales bacterium]|nr:MAG: hypothetical protein EAY70_05020 [Sphingomonadales bacterium]
MDLPIRLHAFRTIFVTWSEFVYGDVRSDARREALNALASELVKLDQGFPDFYNRNIISSDYAVAAWQTNAESARRAVALVEAIGRLQFDTLPFDSGHGYGDFLDTVSFSGPSGRDDRTRWRAAQRAAIGADCTILTQNEMTLQELALAPLWPDSSSAALETNLTMGLSTKNMRELGVNIEKWVRERKDGSLILNQPIDKARERVVRIANLPQSFWERRSPAETLHAFDYCLYGGLQNSHWGRVT